ncbi:MAG: sigma-70 family RNA polymerase sigma factor [Gemmatimonadales bacterium]|jgi:RNA polymerase sigma-70 factor (ECF subfamily)|nr:sigma-70 family RNA polymerase sigma factor [Gemmatimonadales bacterium]
MRGVDDAALARRAAAGDAAAFGELVSRLGPAVRRVARVILDDPDDADDAAQEGFLAAWRALDRFDPARPFEPWLMRIVVNAARDLRRRRGVRATVTIAPELPSDGPRPDQAAGDALLRDRLRSALARLPERQRLAVTLFDAEGWSHAEIAELVELPEGTVRSDLHQARRALRTALGGLWKEQA